MSDKLFVAKGCVYSRDTIETQRNNNALIVGATGSGKTRHVVTPNLLNAREGSFVVVDPKGSLYNQCLEPMMRRGYHVKKLNFSNPEDVASRHWNPFDAVLTDQDVTALAHALTFADGTVTVDRFWDESAVLLFSALISYLKTYCVAEACSVESLINMINKGSSDFDSDADTKATLDYLFDDIREKDPDSAAVRMYDAVRTARGRTWSSILVTAAAKVAIYGTGAMARFLRTDDRTISLPQIGLEKTALFVVVSDTDRSLDGLVSLFFSQLLHSLVDMADGRPEHRLPYDVSLILDDFATNIVLPGFPRTISSIRSRGISAMVMIQDLTQLIMRYGREASTIVANCDTLAYMGGQDMDTAERVARRAGVTEAEVLSMPPGKMFVFRRGEKPVYADRLDAEEERKKKNERKESAARDGALGGRA